MIFSTLNLRIFSLFGRHFDCPRSGSRAAISLRIYIDPDPKQSLKQTPFTSVTICSLKEGPGTGSVTGFPNIQFKDPLRIDNLGSGDTVTLTVLHRLCARLK